MEKLKILELIKREMKINGITISFLANRLSIDEQELERKLDGESKLELQEFSDIVSILNPSIEKASKMLGIYKEEFKC